jgi:hypothetical protein
LTAYGMEDCEEEAVNGCDGYCHSHYVERLYAS